MKKLKFSEYKSRYCTCILIINIFAVLTNILAVSIWKFTKMRVPLCELNPEPMVWYERDENMSLFNQLLNNIGKLLGEIWDVIFDSIPMS